MPRASGCRDVLLPVIPGLHLRALLLRQAWYRLQVQLVALQHLTACLLFMSPRGMPPIARCFPNRIRTTLPSRALGGVSGLGGITTGTTTITRGVRWIVFA